MPSGAPAEITNYVTLEVDLAAGPLDTPTWTSPLTAYLVAGSGGRGRGGVGPDDQYAPGHATFTIDNTTGVLDPTVWYRGKRIRLTTYAGDGIFTGFILRVTHDQSNAPHEAWATIECIDQWTFDDEQTLAGFGITVPADGRLVPPVGTSGLLFSVPWTPDDYGATDAQVYNRAELIRAWCENELGSFQIDGDGNEVFHNRWHHWLTTSLPAIFQLTDDDTALDGGATPMLAKADGGTLELSQPEETYRDRAVWTGLSGRQQFGNVTPPAGYNPTVVSRSSRCPDDNWCRANATLLAKVHSSQTPFWRRFTVRAAPEPTGTTIGLATLRLGTALTVTANPVGGSPITSNVFIESIDWSFTAEPPLFDIVVGTSSYDAWTEAFGPSTDYGYYDDGLVYDDGKKYLT